MDGLSLVEFLLGVLSYAVFRVLITGFYTVRPDERAVLTSFGRAQRLVEGARRAPALSDDERERYDYPRIRVRGPGGPYFKWPWQKVHKVRVVTEAIDLAWDPTKEQTTIEAVTKDNLTIGVNGQIRFKVSADNLYPYLFGVKGPLEHVMGYFISVMRERIANFVDPKGKPLIEREKGIAGESESNDPGEYFEGVSINDLRKNLPLLNTFMEEQCKSTAGRYGIELDSALITGIDPPQEVDHALSAINSTRNQVAADLSTARADADQQITMSKRAVEIAMNNAQAEVAPLVELAQTLSAIKTKGGPLALKIYLRNLRVPLFARTERVVELAHPEEG